MHYAYDEVGNRTAVVNEGVLFVFSGVVIEVLAGMGGALRYYDFSPSHRICRRVAEACVAAMKAAVMVGRVFVGPGFMKIFAASS